MTLQLVVITIIVAIILHCIWKRYRIYRLRSQLGLTGPKGNFLLGNMTEIFGSKHIDQPMLILNDWRKQFGDVFGYYVGPKLTVFVADLDMIKDVLIKKFDCFVDRMEFSLDEPNPMCHNISILKGEQWKTLRNSISPAFTISKMRQMAYIINEKVDTFMEKMARHETLGETFDIHSDFQALTLDAIGQCAFAMQVHCQTDQNDPFLLSVREIFRLFDFRNSPLIKLAFAVPELVKIVSKFRAFTRLNAMNQMLVGHLRKVLEERKRTLKANENRRTDFLQFLLEQQADKDKESKRKWKLTDDVIVGNAYVFLLAGYETTSTALGFTVWLLAKHKNIQKKLQDEISEKLATGSAIDYDFVNKLPYMDAVFHETLRYFSIAQILQRVCVKDCTIGSVNFKPGVEVQIYIPGIHHDPNIWPEPEDFEPERFLDNKSYNPMAWLPFGAGPRNCIGMRFVDMEYKMVLARLLTKYTIGFGSDSEDPLSVIDYSFLLRPKNGVKVRLVRIANDS